MGLLEDIVQYGKDKFNDAVTGAKKDIEFTTDYKNRVQKEYLYTPDLMPSYIMARVGGTLSFYELINEKRGVTSQYPLGDLSAKAQFEKEVEKAAFLLNLNQNDLALVVNMMRSEADVSQSPVKKMGRRVIRHTTSRFIDNTFHIKTGIGNDVADFSGFSESKKQTTVTADLYFYRQIVALPPRVARRVLHRATGLPRGATALLTP